MYGFENGDRLLQYLAGIISNSISGYKRNYFIGHIGGDDFIIIIESCDVADICQNIIDAFDNSIRSFYSDADLERGFVNSKNRRGEEEKFSMASLSIAGVNNMNRSFKNIYILSEYSSKLKKSCKEKGCSFYIIE